MSPRPVLLPCHSHGGTKSIHDDAKRWKLCLPGHYSAHVGMRGAAYATAVKLFWIFIKRGSFR